MNGPTIAFNLADGAVITGTVSVRATAVDHSGKGIANVTLATGGLSASNNPRPPTPWAFVAIRWYALDPDFAAGEHLFTATARDAAGNSASAQLRLELVK